MISNECVPAWHPRKQISGLEYFASLDSFKQLRKMLILGDKDSNIS